MADELVMPRLSDTMERGTIARWVVKEGDAFQNGDVLAEIETDKALMELSAYDDGVLLKILVPDGAEAELGAPIAITGEAGEEVSAGASAGDDGAKGWSGHRELWVGRAFCLPRLASRQVQGEGSGRRPEPEAGGACS